MTERGDNEPTALLAARYRLGEVLGRGGMSTVYRAWDEKLERAVAVKMFASDEPIAADRERRLREAHVLASVSHPHLVTLFDAEWPSSQDARQPAFLVMELVEGESLRRRIDRDGPDSDLAAQICVELAAALAHLHGRGIVHRDLKPENILIEDAGGSVKLVDFGIARMGGSERITVAGIVLGTAAYLSPEQVSGGDVGPPSDIYSLGLVVLECLTGHREYPGSAPEAAVARLARSPAIPAEMSEGWRALLLAMTERDASARPSATMLADSVDSLRKRGDMGAIGDRATAVLDTLPTVPMLAGPERAEDDGTSGSDSGSPMPPASLGPNGSSSARTTTSRKRRLVVVLAAGVAALCIVGAAVAWTSLNGQSRPDVRTPVPTVVVTAPAQPSGTDGSGSVSNHPGNGKGHGNGHGNGGKQGNGG
ncbi:hypothetical protein GCM10028798_07660 [Humibacter antri]